MNAENIEDVIEILTEAKAELQPDEQTSGHLLSALGGLNHALDGLRGELNRLKAAAPPPPAGSAPAVAAKK